MRANLKGRLTTTYRRASRRVKFKFTESFWLAVVADPETLVWQQHGIIHRQIGTDGRNHMVWPDQTVHKSKPSYAAFYTFFANDAEHAQQISDAVCKSLNAPPEQWVPSAGTTRGLIAQTSPFTVDESLLHMRRNVNTLEIRE